MADALEELKERLAEVTDLGKVARLLSWDQQTMMPPAGTAHRADQFATLSASCTSASPIPRSAGCSRSSARSRSRSTPIPTTAR